MSHILNAKITKTTLGVEDHGIFSLAIHLDFGGYTQSFGGYALDEYDSSTKERVGVAFGAELIRKVVKLFDCNWEQLPGKFCRVERQNGSIRRIGHILEDNWLDVEQLGASFRDKK